jgi:hypothetical protein
MANIGDFLSGVIGYQMKQNERSQDEAAYAKKLKLANDMAIELEQRKRALAQQYPTYAQFMKTPEGGIVGVDTLGNVKELRSASPEEREAALEERRAKSAEDRARAAYSEAQIKFLNEKTDNPQRFMQQPRQPSEKRPPNELSASGFDSGYYRFLKSRGTKDVLGNTTPAEDTPEMRQAYQEYVRQMGLSAPGGARNLLSPTTSGNSQGMDPEYMDSVRQAMGEFNFFTPQSN